MDALEQLPSHPLSSRAKTDFARGDPTQLFIKLHLQVSCVAPLVLLLISALSDNITCQFSLLYV